MNATRAHGQLCIWTDIRAADEADFNAWYDGEHMQERLAIPGFLAARRFRATDPQAARRYLALYVTESLDVFSSAAYRAAFGAQTDWSLRNFAKMTDTQRRVGELTLEVTRGAGPSEGAHLAMVVLAAGGVDEARIAARLEAARDRPGMIAGRLFVTAPALSMPLSAPASASPPPADALLLIEASDPAVAMDVARDVAGDPARQADDVHAFTLLWRLGA